MAVQHPLPSGGHVDLDPRTFDAPQWAAASSLAAALCNGSVPVAGRTVLDVGGLGVVAATACLLEAKAAVSAGASATLAVAEANAAHSAAQQQAAVEAAGEEQPDEAKDGEQTRKEPKKNDARSVTSVAMDAVDDAAITALQDQVSARAFDVVVVACAATLGDALLPTVARLLSTPGTAYVALSAASQTLLVEGAAAAVGLVVSTGAEYVTLRHNIDAAGPPLPVEQDYDVVVQGTGLVEGLVSAAAARAGLKVLHLDSQGSYGGVLRAMRRSDFFGDYLGRPDGVAADGAPVVEHPMRDAAASLLAAEKALAEEAAAEKAAVEEKEADKATAAAEGPEAVKEDGEPETAEPTASEPKAPTAGEAMAAEAESIASHRAVMFDALPLLHVARADLLTVISQCQMAQHVELQNLSRAVRLDAAAHDQSWEADSPVGESADADPHPFGIAALPFSRADVFKSKAFSPMEMRRVVQFLQAVVEADTTDEPTAARGAATQDPLRVGHDAAEIAPVSGLPKALAGLDATATMGDVAQRFKLSETALRTLSVDGLLFSSASAAAAGVCALRCFVTSVGHYGGPTPLLTPQYGSDELPQIMARMAAVWDATFVLRRSLRDIPTEATESISADRPAGLVTLSSGQRVRTRCVVAAACGLSPTGDGAAAQAAVKRNAAFAFGPTNGGVRTAADASLAHAQHLAEVAGSDLPVARVALLVKGTVVSWEALEAKARDTPGDAEDREFREQARDPLVAGAVRLTSHGTPFTASVVQLTSISHHCGPGAALLHVTAPVSAVPAGSELPHAALLAAVKRGLFTASSYAATVVSAAAFTLCPRRAAALAGTDGTVTVAAESLDARSAAPVLVVPVPISFAHVMDDGAYERAAEAAFRVVEHRCRPALYEKSEWPPFLVEPDPALRDGVGLDEAAAVDDSRPARPAAVVDTDPHAMARGDDVAQLLGM